MWTLLGTEAKGCPGGINGHGASSHHGNPFAFDIGYLAEGDIFQEFRSMINSGEVLSGDSKATTLVRADGQDHGAKALLVQKIIRS